MFRRNDRDAAEALDRALLGPESAVVDPAVQPMVRAARTLRPAAGQSPEHRDKVLAALRRAHETRTAARSGMGTLDGDGGTVAVTEVPGAAGTVRMADVERITPERAAQVAASLDLLLARHNLAR